MVRRSREWFGRAVVAPDDVISISRAQLKHRWCRRGCAVQQKRRINLVLSLRCRFDSTSFAQQRHVKRKPGIRGIAELPPRLPIAAQAAMEACAAEPRVEAGVAVQRMRRYTPPGVMRCGHAAWFPRLIPISPAEARPVQAALLQQACSRRWQQDTSVGVHKSGGLMLACPGPK